MTANLQMWIFATVFGVSAAILIHFAPIVASLITAAVGH
jgi:hypothetical protein